MICENAESLLTRLLRIEGIQQLGRGREKERERKREAGHSGRLYQVFKCSTSVGQI